MISFRFGELIEIYTNFGESEQYTSHVIRELSDLPFSVNRQQGILLGGIPMYDQIHQNNISKDFKGGKLPNRVSVV